MIHSIKEPTLSETPEIVALPVLPHVQLIIMENGEVRGVMGAENPALAQLLSTISKLTDSGFPVVRQENLLFPVGQDCYVVTREFVLFVRGALLGLNWREIQSLEAQLPAHAKYTFVVSI